jgi:hypothetical protein
MYQLLGFYFFIDLQAGYRVGDAGYWGLDTRYSILDTGCWMPNDKLPMTKFDDVVKSPNSVTPAKAGVQELLK